MDLIIVGAGGHAKEIAFLIDRTNQYNLIGFVDDNQESWDKTICGKKVLGSSQILLSYSNEIAVVIGIANPLIKKKMYNDLKQNHNLFFPNIIDSTALVGIEIKMGIGNILMPYTTYTSDITIGDFNMFNINTTIGHDTMIENFNSFFPNVNVSGNVHIGNCNQFGVGTKIIQSISIGNGNIVGAGSVIIRNINNCTKNVGVPTKTIESWD